MDEKYRRLQSRLSFSRDRSETGQTPPRTAQALQAEFPHAALAEALVTERLLLAAGEPIETTDRAVIAFTGAKAMRQWKADARPVPMSGPDAAMMAIAIGKPRILVDQKLLLPRPAVEAIAAADRWIPPWEDIALVEELGKHSRIIPGSEPLVIEIYARTKEEAESEIRRISALRRLGVSAEQVEFRPQMR